jgi:hypothetical protein
VVVTAVVGRIVVFVVVVVAAALLGIGLAAARTARR